MALPMTEKKKETLYKTKVINFFGRKIPIILQDRNGPCTLISICNVFLLRGVLKLSTLIPEVSELGLVEFVEERMINSLTSGKYNDEMELFGKAYELHPKLATGIDVNMKFRRINDFEYTAERAIFDLVDIRLYHGWLVDPQDRETSEALGSMSYDTLLLELSRLEILENESGTNNEEDTVDTVPATTASLDVPSTSDSASLIHKVDEPESSSTATRCEEKLSKRQGELVDNFRKNNLAQLTVYGISCLQNEVMEHEPCVFFRNNHFYTMLKHKGELYTLVTDEGYAKQLDLVWEKLNEVDGNSLYMTGEFKEFKLNDFASSSREEPNAMTNADVSDVDWSKFFNAPGFDEINTDDPSNNSPDDVYAMPNTDDNRASRSHAATAAAPHTDVVGDDLQSLKTGLNAMNMDDDLDIKLAITMSLKDNRAGTSSESQEQSSLMTDEECARYLQKYGKLPDQGN